MRKPGPWLKALGLAIGLGLFGWIILGALGKSQSVGWPPVPTSHIWLALGIVTIAHGLHGAAWVVGARQIAPGFGWASGMATYSVSFLGRYIPGNIWQIGGLVFLARQRGADAFQIAGYSLAFLVAFPAIGALLFFLALLTQNLPFGWAVCVIGAAVSVFAVAALCRFSGETILKRLSASWQQRFGASLNQPFWALAMNLGLLTAKWFLLVTAGYIIVEGFQPAWGGTWGQSAAAVTGGIIAGFLVLIAPSGAGVRESTISIWLGSVGVDPVAAIAIAIALRLTMTVGELFWALVGAAILVLAPGPDPS